MLKIGDIKAALFDMDGLIADTEAMHVSSYHKMAHKLGIKLDDVYIHSFIGVATKDNVNRIIQDFNIKLKLEEVLKIRYDYYLEEIRNAKLEPMEGAEEIIIYFKNLGLKTALVTSSIKEQAIEVLKKIFSDYIVDKNKNFELKIFDIMTFGDDVTHPKPNPEIYLRTSKILGLSPASCLVFEDSEAGVISAKTAGMYVVAVPNYHTKNQDFSKADLILSSLKDFNK